MPTKAATRKAVPITTQAIEQVFSITQKLLENRKIYYNLVLIVYICTTPSEGASKINTKFVISNTFKEIFTKYFTKSVYYAGKGNR